MSAYQNGGLLARNILEITSIGLAGHIVRREVSAVDAVRFYRFTVNPGVCGEYGTFWAEDEYALLSVVYRRLGIM